jgi:hypothetical protein
MAGRPRAVLTPDEATVIREAMAWVANAGAAVGTT